MTLRMDDGTQRRLPRGATRGLAQQPALRIDVGSGRLYVSGRLSHAARALPGAMYNQKRQAYELSLTLPTLSRLKELLNWSARDLAAHCSDEVMRWARAARAAEDQVMDLHDRIAAGYRTDLPWLDRVSGFPPFEHQTVMATVAAELSGCAFLCEMGTGKTRGAVEAAAEWVRRGEVDMVLVLCPAGVMGTWVREVNRWTDTLTPERLDGAVEDRRRWLRAAAGLDGQMRLGPIQGLVPILNYDVLFKLEADIIEIARRIRLGFILDEGHRVRNPQAKVTKSAMSVARHCPRRLLMTGTPILNGVENIWSQWYIVDLGVTFGANYRQFRREFFDENPWAHELTPLDGTLDEVGARMQRRGLRYRKADCLDLPPKVYEVQECDMTPKQARAYRDMAEELLVQLAALDESMADRSEESVAAMQLVMMLRLSQITSGFLPMKDDEGRESVVRFDPNPKLALCKEIVDEAIEAGASVLVWAWYRHDIAALTEAFRQHNPVVIAGGMHARDRDEAERAFQAGTARVLIGNPASAGLGLTLTAASVAVYYSQNFNLEHRAQSEDRCHRAGSERHNRVTYVDLSCRGTIDELIRESLAGKLSVAEAVVDMRRALEQGV